MQHTSIFYHTKVRIYTKNWIFLSTNPLFTVLFIRKKASDTMSPAFGLLYIMQFLYISFNWQHSTKFFKNNNVIYRFIPTLSPCKHHSVIIKLISTCNCKPFKQVVYREFLFLFTLYVEDYPALIHHYQSIAMSNCVPHVVSYHN